MKNSPLLTILQDGEIHSGEKLAQALGVSRSAIWKHIQQLQAADIPIHSQTSKGYYLEGGIELLNEDQIYHEMSAATQSYLKELVLLDSIPSTNDYVLNAIRQQAQLPLACFCEQQTQGRGRGGRAWVSPYGNNIYFSLGWHFDKDPAELLGLSLVAGVLVLNALRRYGFDPDFSLKWPNDILWQGRKLGGILTEVIAQSHSSCEVVLGIGLNTQLPVTIEIDQPWVSLSEIAQNKIARNRLSGLLLDESISCFRNFEMNGLASYIEQWREFDYCKNKPITLQQAKQTIHGIAQGISDKGELLVLTEENQLKHFMSGEINTVRASN